MGESQEKFAEIIQKVSQQSLEVEDFSSFNKSDFQNLGRFCNENNIGFLEIYHILTFIKNTDNSCKLAFLEKLNYDFLAKDVALTKIGINQITGFIRITQHAGITRETLAALPTKLDFADLGHRTAQKNIPVTTVAAFLRRIQQVGASDISLKKFCDKLDFEALGKQAAIDGISITTIRNFLKELYSASVHYKKQKKFCDQLNCKLLGEKATDKAFNNIVQFLRFTHLAGIDENKHHDFFDSIDIQKLGKVVNLERILDSLLFFNQLYVCKAFTRDMARELIESIGWEAILNSQYFFPPEKLAFFTDFLLYKCQFTPQELQENGYDFSSERFFESFITNPCKVKSEIIFLIKQYFHYSLWALTSIDISARLQSSEMKFPAWNILLYNLKTMKADHLLHIVSSVLKSFSPSRFDDLFSQTDLRNISTFLMHFDPQTGVLDVELPHNIDFKSLKLFSADRETDLLGIAHFLFCFYYINRFDISQHFATQLFNHSAELLKLIQTADIRTIDFFVWNWFMSLPPGQKPLLFQDSNFHEIIVKKSNDKDFQKHFLGIIGTMKLSDSPVVNNFRLLVKIKDAKRICQEASDFGDIALLRLLGGLWVLTDFAGHTTLHDRKKVIYLRALGKLHNKLKLNVSNQQVIMRKLVEWLKEGLERKRKSRK